MEGYLSSASEVDGLLIKFEDLVSGALDLGKIARHIGVDKLDESILQKKINAPEKTIRKPEISRIDRSIISFLCRRQMQNAGYL